MAPQSLTLWLLLFGGVLSHGCCQHWSYGLSPGGKRDLDRLSDALAAVVETPCGVLGCEESPPFPRLYRMKGFLGGATDRERVHASYKK